MKIVDPKVELITEQDVLKRLELCGRVCYKSEDRITPDSALKFVNAMIKSGHTSVLEHAYVLAPSDKFNDRMEELATTGTLPYGLSDRLIKFHHSHVVVCNVRDLVKLGFSIDDIASFPLAPNFYTVRFTCDRGISHELVRHRTMSFSQESTRYVNYQKKGLEFVRPLPFEWAKENFKYVYEPIRTPWIKSCEQAEEAYNNMLKYATPQEARAVLPNCLKTELIMTGTKSMWKDVIELRTGNGAHPQVKYLMEMLLAIPEFKLED